MVSEATLAAVVVGRREVREVELLEVEEVEEVELVVLLDVLVDGAPPLAYLHRELCDKNVFRSRAALAAAPACPRSRAPFCSSSLDSLRLLCPLHAGAVVVVVVVVVVAVVVSSLSACVAPVQRCVPRGRFAACCEEVLAESVAAVVPGLDLGDVDEVG